MRTRLCRRGFWEAPLLSFRRAWPPTDTATLYQRQNRHGLRLQRLAKHLLSTQRKNRPSGGGRPLTDPSTVFRFNNWDNIEWDAEQEEEARNKVQENSKTLVSKEFQEKYEVDADQFWDKFYMQHQNRFFKDRHWLFTEFPELAPRDFDLKDIPCRADAETPQQDRDATEAEKTQCAQGTDATGTLELGGRSQQPGAKEAVKQATDAVFPGQHATTRMLEVGCGVGNTVFPVLQTNSDPGLFIYCCDLSSTAIQLVKEHRDYTKDRCHAFVCNVADPACSVPFPDESLDIVILIFVLSAIHPDKFQDTISRLAKMVKPGGLILLRDYGRYDMAQLRFKDGRCLSENFYARGDGTRVYFFTQEELRDLFCKAGLSEEQNYIDRRLQVNRGRQLKMYRVWIQCKYRKPLRTNLS